MCEKQRELYDIIIKSPEDLKIKSKEDLINKLNRGLDDIKNVWLC